MSQIHKTALSFLLTILSFGTVSYLEYNDVFPGLERRLYDQNRVREIERKLERAGEISMQYRREMLDRLRVLAAEPYTESIFSLDQKRPEVMLRENAFGALRETAPEITAIRFVAPDFEKIHYSSAASDLKQDSETLREYLDMDESETAWFTERISPSGSGPLVFLSVDGSGFRYVVPVRSGYGIVLGYGVFSVDMNGLIRHLERVSVVEDRESVLLTDEMLLVLDSDLLGAGIVERALHREFISGGRAGIDLLVSDTGSTMAMLSTTFGDQLVGTVIDERVLHLDTSVAILIPVTFCVTCFLLFFCLLNLRQSRRLVISQRLSRFKTLFLQEFMARPPVDAETLRGELVLHRSEILAGIIPDLAGRKRQIPAVVEKRYDAFFSELLSLCTSLGAHDDRAAVVTGQMECVFERALNEGVLARVERYGGFGCKAGTREDDPEISEGEISPIRNGEDSTASSGGSAESEQADDIVELQEIEESEELAELEEIEERQGFEGLDEVDEREELEAVDVEEFEDEEDLEPVDELEPAETSSPVKQNDVQPDRNGDRSGSPESRT